MPVCLFMYFLEARCVRGGQGCLVGKGAETALPTQLALTQTHPEALNTNICFFNEHMKDSLNTQRTVGARDEYRE